MYPFLVVATVVITVLLGLVVYRIGSPKGPRLEDVANLKTPRIVTMPPQKVLLVTARGDPNVVGKKAFGLLLSTYYKLEGAPKGGPAFKPPRARWPLDPDVPADEWVGHYAMPIADSVTALPAVPAKDGLTVELAVWEYGQVAEILHVGPYDAEQPAIETLKAFVAELKYRIVGEHEEEYLKGPGMLFAGDPTTYLTMIRYRVGK